MFPHSCALRPWGRMIPVSYSFPCQLATVSMGSHSNQTTEAAVTKPASHLQDGKELAG